MSTQDHILNVYIKMLKSSYFSPTYACKRKSVVRPVALIMISSPTLKSFRLTSYKLHIKLTNEFLALIFNA